ncbi:MAG: hypothetical protein Q8J97_04045, partial [Flavobacteriaceae bacterium]|nr:hypothetical protein [Flavobacteriaceae bacterium]
MNADDGLALKRSRRDYDDTADAPMTIDAIPSDLLDEIIALLGDGAFVRCTASPALIEATACTIAAWQDGGVFGRRLWRLDNVADQTLLLARNAFLTLASALCVQRWVFNVWWDKAATIDGLKFLAQLTMLTKLMVFECPSLTPEAA